MLGNWLLPKKSSIFLKANPQHISRINPPNTISGVCDGHRNRKSQKTLRFQCAKIFGNFWLSLGVFQRPLTLILLQKYRDTNGSRIVIQIGGVYTTLCQEEGILLQKYAIEMGGVSRYFSKVLGSGVDLTLLISASKIPVFQFTVCTSWFAHPWCGAGWRGASLAIPRGKSFAAMGIWLSLTWFWPILTYFDAFCQAGLTYFHLFWPISPGGPDLFSPISTYFVSQQGSMGGTPKSFGVTRIGSVKFRHFQDRFLTTNRFGSSQNFNGGFGGCSPVPKTGTRVHSDVPPVPKHRNEGTFECSAVPETGTRAQSPKPPFFETALLFPLGR